LGLAVERAWGLGNEKKTGKSLGKETHVARRSRRGRGKEPEKKDLGKVNLRGRDPKRKKNIIAPANGNKKKV